MSIQFACPGCGQRISVPENTAGKKGKCPKCQAPIVVPGSATPVVLVPPPAPSVRAVPAATTPQGTIAGVQATTMEIRCPVCHKDYGIDETLPLNATVKCPHCNSAATVSKIVKDRVSHLKNEAYILLGIFVCAAIFYIAYVIWSVQAIHEAVQSRRLW